MQKARYEWAHANQVMRIKKSKFSFDFFIDAEHLLKNMIVPDKYDRIRVV